ncbi:hypothetical protein DVH24_027298 [Malus domestica]|uniref:Uncharacterized protein n=1 Tax=Malus domestica TaxID=3750 RepID=A0A498IML6_MALDO|nr:hypothetical protein DVH24_027298 [Malus domestica]
MARQVVYFHQNKVSPALGFSPLEPSVIRLSSTDFRKVSFCKASCDRWSENCTAYHVKQLVQNLESSRNSKYISKVKIRDDPVRNSTYFVSSHGYSEAQLKECLEEYANINVWQINPPSFDIRFIDAI